jgi:Xaa-Pro aminopeptidase
MVNRIDRLDAISKSRNIDAYLLTSGAAIRYLSGYFYNLEGPSNSHLIPAAVFGIPGCYQSLIVADNESEQLHLLDPRMHVIPYTSYVYDKPLDFSAVFRDKLIEVIKANGLRVEKLGVEADSLPFSLCESLAENFPGIELIDVTVDLTKMRMIKDDHEISLIRNATHLCNIGQRAFLKYSEAGMTEIDLFKKIRAEMEKEAGKHFPLISDLLSGNRTTDAQGSPTLKKIGKEDLVLCKLTACFNGYWSSTCNTIPVSQISSMQVFHFHLLKEALDLGTKAIKPGIPVKNIDTLIRTHLLSAGKFTHHTGHGIGLSYQEEPIISSYNDTILAPNMILTLGPGIYTDYYGIRLEQMIAVTETGYELLSELDFRPEK